MLSRKVLAGKPVTTALASLRRGFASESAGIKVSTLENSSPVSEVSLIVRAGSRYEPSTAPGVAHILEKFAYRNTTSKSALRLVRESELLGGQLSSKLTRESLILTTKFLREDLPYFVEALGNVAKHTIYNKYELDEEVSHLAQLEYEIAHQSAVYTATEAAFQAAFHGGLGNSLLGHPSSPVTIDAVKNFGREVYTKANVSLVAKGVNGADFNKFVAENFGDLSSGSEVTSAASTIHSGESRIRAGGSNVVVLAFPAAGAESATAYGAIAQYLGTSQHSIKWSLGGSTPLGVASRKTGASIHASSEAFSDASILTVTIAADTAESARNGTFEAVSAIKALASGLTSEQASRAIAKAKFANIEASELDITVPSAGTQATPESIKDVASKLLSGKVVVSVVGKTSELPYADELL